MGCRLTRAKIFLNQLWIIVNWTLRNTLQWNLNRNSNIFIQENAFESVVCETVAILSRPQCVKAKPRQGSKRALQVSAPCIFWSRRFSSLCPQSFYPLTMFGYRQSQCWTQCSASAVTNSSRFLWASLILYHCFQRCDFIENRRQFLMKYGSISSVGCSLARAAELARKITSQTKRYIAASIDAPDMPQKACNEAVTMWPLGGSRI